MDARELARFLTIQFRYTAFVFKGNLEGLSDADALRQPEPAGNCINWVAGHIVRSRAGIVQVTGAAPPFEPDLYLRYKRSTDPLTAADGAIPLSRMREDFAATGEPLAAGLAGLNDAMLAAPAPYSPGGNPDETVGTLLVGLAFHEAYHTGQLGILRRVAGRPGVIR
jgi:hypothetical protein